MKTEAMTNGSYDAGVKAMVDEKTEVNKTRPSARIHQKLMGFSGYPSTDEG